MHAYSIKGLATYCMTTHAKLKYNVFSESKASHEKLHVKFQVVLIAGHLCGHFHICTYFSRDSM